MAKMLSLLGTDLFPSDGEQPCLQCKDLDRLILLSKEKCSTATRQEQIKLLTLIPQSWSIQKTIHKFEVTEHVVRRFRELKKQRGILADPDPKKGKSLYSDLTKEVISFYQLDDY